MTANNTGKKQKTVKYFDPTCNQQVERTCLFPNTFPAASPNGGPAVQEIGSLEELRDLWTNQAMGDLPTGLGAEGRTAVCNALCKVLSSPDERDVIRMLSSTGQTSDDRALKLLVRAMHHIEVARERARTAEAAQATAVALKRNAEDDVRRHKTSLSEQGKDLIKSHEARDRLQRHIATVTAQHTAAVRDVYRLNDANAKLQRDCESLAQSYEQAAKDRVESAVNEYESEVLVKLTEVAAERTKMVDEVATLKAENARLKGERNVLRSQVEHQQNVNADLEKIAEATKECEVMSEPQQEVQMTADRLGAGDEVFCKVSGEGPFVLMTMVDEAHIEYANPITNRKNSFHCGKLPVSNAWLVRCKDGSFRTLPEPALTKSVPKSTFSFGGVKSLVTSEVTSKLFQAAIWVVMLTMLYLQRG